MGKELGFPDAFKDYKSAHFLQSVDVLSEFDSFDDASAAAAELMNNAANAMYGDYEIADAAHSEFSPMNAYGDYVVDICDRRDIDLLRVQHRRNRRRIVVQH